MLVRVLGGKLLISLRALITSALSGGTMSVPTAA